MSYQEQSERRPDHAGDLQLQVRLEGRECGRDKENNCNKIQVSQGCDVSSRQRPQQSRDKLLLSGKHIGLWWEDRDLSNKLILEPEQKLRHYFTATCTEECLLLLTIFCSKTVTDEFCFQRKIIKFNKRKSGQRNCSALNHIELMS